MKYIYLLLILLLSSAVFAEVDFDAYQPIPLKEIIANHGADFGDSKVLSLSGIPFKYNSKIVFTNQFRTIDIKRKEFLGYWAKALQAPVEFVNQYEEELLVKIGEKQLWIPIQKQVKPFMHEELSSNKAFNIYYILSGKLDGEWVFISTEFGAI
jgi:hypothetical protein